jgi:hypothetical protein
VAHDVKRIRGTALCEHLEVGGVIRSWLHAPSILSMDRFGNGVHEIAICRR